MIKQRSLDRQIIVATQSPRFVDSFDLGEIIVLNIRDGKTECRKLDPDEYRTWIEEYAPGELWEKNLLGDRRGTEEEFVNKVIAPHGLREWRPWGLAAAAAEWTETAPDRGAGCTIRPTAWHESVRLA